MKQDDAAERKHKLKGGYNTKIWYYLPLNVQAVTQDDPNIGDVYQFEFREDADPENPLSGFQTADAFYINAL